MIAGLLQNTQHRTTSTRRRSSATCRSSARCSARPVPRARDRTGDHRHAVSGAAGLRPARDADRRLSRADRRRSAIFDGQTFKGVSGPAARGSGPSRPAVVRRRRDRRRSGVQAVTRRSFRKDADHALEIRSSADRLGCARGLQLPRSQADGRPRRCSRSTSRSSTRTDYVFDAAAPDGVAGAERSGAARRLVPRPRPRLRRHDLRRRRLCGRGARAEVARVAGSYGLLVAAGAPVTAGAGRSRARSGSSSAARRARCPAAPTGAGPSQPEFRQSHRCRTSAAR